MAALTVQEIVDIRMEVGTAPDDATLQAIYDRVGSIEETIVEVLAIRHADLERKPTQFSIPGEYSQSTEANLKSLSEKLSGLGVGAGASVVTIVSPPARDGR